MRGEARHGLRGVMILIVATPIGQIEALLPDRRAAADQAAPAA